MREYRPIFLLPVAFLVACGSSYASMISLGSIATNNIAVLGYSPASPSTTNITVTTSGGGQINVAGNVVSPIINNPSGLNLLDGGTTITSGSVLSSAVSALNSAITQLNTQTYTPLTLTSGAVNVITPGTYMISTGTLGAGTVIDLNGNGQYIFETPGATALSLNGVMVNAPGLTSDEVFWYTNGAATITNSNVFGDVIQDYTANTTLQTANSITGTLDGRLLSEGLTTNLVALTGSTLNINTPEPASLAFVFLGLSGFALAARRRR